ncbi:MAG: EFR1 family ferrodoxin [Clostridia bacterium]|nr:EFR1 family ferrodoxin [Clostridia bacterium]
MIFWYSGTGNSYWAASEMAKYFDDRLIPIADAVRNGEYEYELKHGEAIGIVCPVYYWGVPQTVKTFAENVCFPGGKHYTWLLTTCGGSSCAAVDLINETLPVDWFAELRMPDNFILMMNDVRHRDEIRATLMNARNEMGKIYNAVRKREKKDIGKNLFIFSRFITKKAWPHYHKQRTTEKYYATDACTGCGKCAKNCPVQAIEMRDGKPVWVKETCDFCLGCVHRCPAKALQRGKATVKRGRYVHPIWKETKGDSPFDV